MNFDDGFMVNIMLYTNIVVLVLIGGVIYINLGIKEVIVVVLGIIDIVFMNGDLFDIVLLFMVDVSNVSIFVLIVKVDSGFTFSGVKDSGII